MREGSGEVHVGGRGIFVGWRGDRCGTDGSVEKWYFVYEILLLPLFRLM